MMIRFEVEPGPFQGAEGGMKLTFQWFPRRPEVLSGLPLLPSFLQTYKRRFKTCLNRRAMLFTMMSKNLALRQEYLKERR